MSSQTREPMWYCHECNAEMRPLMTPDPHCASCRGTFVEKIENLDDDPREFHTAEANLDEGLGPFAMLASLNEILRDHSSPGADPLGRRAAASGPAQNRGGSPTRGMGLHFEFGSPNNRRTFVLGGQNTRRDTESNARGTTPNTPPPRLSEFLRGSNEANRVDTRESIPGQLMAQYLLTLLGGGGNRGLPPFLGPMGMGEQGSDNGRWGDYVFTQEALDQIITQMMEGANSTRPVPASEEIVENLPRSVLERGDPLLEKDCAVCKEQFSIDSEDPGDQLVVTLPCKHPFHEGCILPWLKSSGTCPVCRYALIPQPDAHPTEPGSPSGRPSSSGSPPSGASRNPAPEESPSGTSATARGNNPGTGSSASSSGSHANGGGGGFFSNLFGGYNRGGNPTNRSGSTTHSALHSILSPRDRRQSRGSRGGTGETSDTPHRIPGSWGDSLD